MRSFGKKCRGTSSTIAAIFILAFFSLSFPSFPPSFLSFVGASQGGRSQRARPRQAATSQPRGISQVHLHVCNTVCSCPRLTQRSQAAKPEAELAAAVVLRTSACSSTTGYIEHHRITITVLCHPAVHEPRNRKSPHLTMRVIKEFGLLMATLNRAPTIFTKDEAASLNRAESATVPVSGTPARLLSEASQPGAAYAWSLRGLTRRLP